MLWGHVVSVAYICLLCQHRAEAECYEDVITPLAAHSIPNFLKYFTGQFIDVWVSRHVTEILNASFSETFDNGTTNSYVLYKQGQGFMSTAQLTQANGGIITIKVDGSNLTGLIYPVYVTPEVLGYYNCYLNVEGPGVSIITARADSLQQGATFEFVDEAKATFSHLEEIGIPVNDGIDFPDTPSSV